MKTLGTVFYCERKKFSDSDALIRYIYSEFYKIDGTNVEIGRNKNGKPFFKSPYNMPYFSLSHTADYYFFASANFPIGIDAEPLARKIDYLPIISKFSDAERAEILSSRDFLQHWTAKESAVKYLGGTLAADLKKLEFVNGKMYYRGTQTAAIFHTLLCTNAHIIAVACKRQGEDGVVQTENDFPFIIKPL